MKEYENLRKHLKNILKGLAQGENILEVLALGELVPDGSRFELLTIH